MKILITLSTVKPPVIMGGGGQRPVMSSEKMSIKKREASHKNIIYYIFGYSSLSVV